MSKNALVLALAIAMAIVSTIALPQIPRHVDPAQVKEESPLGIALAKLYIALFANIEKLNLGNASKLLKIVKESYVPTELRYIFSRFNQLLNELIDKINATKHLVSLAKKSLKMGSKTAAKSYLSKARLSLGEAWATYREIVDASNQLARLGIPSSALSKGLKRCEKALEELGKEIEDLLRSVKSLNLIKTMISLSVEPKTIVVGSDVRISGCLKTIEGIYLPNRVVEIHVGPRVSRAITNATGCYNYVTKIDLYVHRVPIYAEYIPKGLDEYIYTYARSNTTYVNVTFLETPLSLQISKRELLPGDRAIISIETVPNTTLRIYQPFAEPLTVCAGSDGRVELGMKVPLTAREGTYKVVVVALPHGIYGPSKRVATFRVYRLEPRVEVDAPSIAFSGFPIYVSVRVEPRSRVSIELPELGVSNSSTGVQTRFSSLIPITFLGGKLTMVISVKPLDPRYRAIELAKEVKIYSTPCIALALTPVLALAFLAKRSRARRVEKATSVSEEAEVSTSIRARALDFVIELFLRILELLAKAVGRAIRKCETLREYLYVVKARISPKLLPILERAFRYLEMYIYGDPAKITSSLRLKIVETLKELLHELGGEGG